MSALAEVSTRRAACRRPGGRRLRSWTHRLLGGAFAGVLILGLLIAVLWPLTPSVQGAEDIIAAELSQHHGVDLGTLPAPDRVGTAVIATEDSRFYAHHGLDSQGVLRALFGFTRSSQDPGGATLDQQLSKNLYTPHDTTLDKVKQVELSFKLEAEYGKRQILEMYLSSVYYGHGYYGLNAAAKGYFGERPSMLSWAQASLLAGLLQAPSAYDPYTHLARAKSRQRHVLDRLVAVHALLASQADASYRAPLALRPS